MVEGMDIYCDGLCEPVNPGGWGCWAWVAVSATGEEIAHDSGCLGKGQTNNIAEYHALVQALKWAKERGYSEHLTFRMDSQFVVRQVNYIYAVKAEHLRPLCQEARRLLEGLDASLVWIPREDNTRADALSRQAYREARRK